MRVVAHRAQLMVNGSLTCAFLYKLVFLYQRWMAGQAKLWAHADQQLHRLRCLGSPALVRFASAAAELFHSEALFPEDCSLPSRSRHYLWTPTLVWRPSFVELLDPVKGRHALLLDVQRVDPRRCFPLRISRQESAVSHISSSHTSHLNRGHMCSHVVWSGSESLGLFGPAHLGYYISVSCVFKMSNYSAVWNKNTENNTHLQT